jgi:hypothetical protein
MNSAGNNLTDAYFDFDLIRGILSNLKEKKRKNDLPYPPLCMYISKTKNNPYSKVRSKYSFQGAT